MCSLGITVSTLQKKPKRCQDDEVETAGDWWDHTAVTADSKLVVSLIVGKRTHAQTTALVHDAKRRLRARHLPAIFTDAYTGYESALLEAFGRRYSMPRRGGKGHAPRFVLRWPQGLAYGQVKKQDKGGRVERVEVRALYGKARLQHVLSLLGYKQINTSAIERHNGTSRLRNQRKVRKTLAFSKVPRYHRWMSWLSVGLYNFCRGHRSLKRTQEAQMQHRSPAMAAKLTDHIWTVREWLLWPV
jgi:IS1 family transposase